MRRLKRYLIAFGIVMVVFTVFGFFGLPPILKSVLVKQLSQNLHRDVTIREVKFNPYVLSMTLRGLEIKDRATPQTFVSFDELYVNLQIMSALRRALILKEIRLKKPYLNLVRHQDFSYNFSDLMEKKEPKPEPQTKPKGAPPRFSLNNISIEDGSIDFSDEPVQKKHTIREMKIGVPFISNFPTQINTFVQPAFSTKINDTAYALEGQTKPFADSRETSLDINISDLNIPYYLAYLPMKLNFKIPSAFLDTKAKISFVEYKDRAPSLTISGDVDVKKIAVDDQRDAPLLRLPLLGVTIAPSEPLARKIHLAKISVQSPELEINRDRKGQVNIETLFPKGAEAAKTPVDKETAAKKEEKAAPPLSIDVDEIELAGGKVSFTDLSRTKPFKTKLDPVDVKIDHFSNVKEKKTNYLLSLKTEANETVKLEGELTVDPMKVDGGVDVKSMVLKKYSPYYSDAVLFDIEDGRLDFGTRYTYEKGEKEPLISLSQMSAALAGLRLRKRDEKEDFFKLPTLTLKDTQLNLTAKEAKLGGIFTEKGTLALNRLSTGEFDLQKLLPPPTPVSEPPKLPAIKAPAKEVEKPWLVTLGQLVLDQYTVKMNDRKMPTPVTLLGEKIRVTAENLSTAKNASGKYSLSFLLDKKGTISTRGTVGLDPMKVEGSLEVKKISPATYSPYYKDNILFDIMEGDVDLTTNYRYAKTAKDQEIKLSGASLSLAQFRLKKRDESEDFAVIPAFAVRNTGLDLINKEVSIGEISGAKGSLLVRRFKDGKVNLQTLFPDTSNKVAEKPEQAAPAAVQKVADKAGEKPPEKTAEKPGDKPAEKPWLVKVGRISIDGYAIKVEDQTASEPVTLNVDEIQFKAENLSTAKNQKGNASLALRLNQKGTVSLNGPVGINPLFGDLNLALKEIELAPLQPYFTDRIKIIVQDGALSTAGMLSLSDQEGKGIQIGYKGDSALSHFKSVDKQNAEDFLKWDVLSFDKMDVGYNPLKVHINGIALSNFYSRIIVFPDGTLNLQNIVEKGSDKSEKAAPPQAVQAAKKDAVATKEPQPPSDVKIEQITLQGGEINYTDNFIKPNYSANLGELGGRISGLSSEETGTAEVEVRGKLNGYAPLEIKGKINPLRSDLLVDLDINFNDIDLSPVTPYSGKYVGYSIQKGKLSLNLKYLIVKKKLEAQNKIFFDQLTLGDRIESPTATKLPVKLGIALLKDRKGEINLDIPVSGNLDDPKFSIFSIVIRIITNLLVKAATSPFALLGSVFGGGEQLEYMDFDYGSSAIQGENLKKLDTLVKILQDRPGIKLEVEGHVDAEKDREGLKKLFFDRKLKAQRLKELVKKGAPPVSVDEVKIDPPDYAKYLKAAYKEEKFPKPKNFLGMDKDIPGPDMEKLMMTNIEVKEDDLRALASQRAQKVKEGILKGGQVQPERIFIVEPKSLAPEKKETLKDSRVNFKLG